MSNLIKIELYNNVETIDSRLVAQRLDIQHKNLLETIKTYQEKIESNFGRIPFETLNVQVPIPNTNKFRIDEKLIYHLTEEQAIFVATLSRNSEVVVTFKADLVKAFSEYRKALLKPLTPEQQLAASVLYATKLLEEKDKQIEVLTPLAEYTNEVLQSETVYDVNEIAKELGTSAITLNKRLHEQEIQYKNNNGVWLLYAKYQNKGYTKTTTEIRKNGTKVVTTMRTVWTEAGRKFIHTLFNGRISESSQHYQQIGTTNRSIQMT